jgi:hypothetical protein
MLLLHDVFDVREIYARKLDEYAYLPHHKSSWEESSLTTRLSRGDRPVLAPERVARAPVEVMKDPFSYLIACSYSSSNITKMQQFKCLF